MQAALRPISEAARLRSLSDYRILGTKPGKGFHNITRMAPEICQSPIALISLVEDALFHEKFRDNPLAQEESHVRLHAGFPLQTDINHHQFLTAAVIEWRRWSGWQMERTAKNRPEKSGAESLTKKQRP